MEQQYLPYELTGKKFYEPSWNGYEAKIREHMQRIKAEAQGNEKENEKENGDA